MNIKGEISVDKVRQDAEDNYRNGYFCCEALMAAIVDNFEMDVPREVIAMSSGMAVGMVFGRTEQKGPKDPKVVKCMELTHELHDYFREANGKHSNCCRVLTREFDMGAGEHKEQCIRFTGIAAKKVAEIIVREKGLKNLDEE